MTKRLFAVLSLIALFASLAFAHGGEEHVMGTVQKISATSITVETAKRETREVAITDKTAFTKSGASAKWSDVKVGDRVVIHAEKEKDKLVAHTVKFGATKTTAHSH